MFFLVGDAAGQIKSTTGGGIIQSIIAAKCLSTAINEKKDYTQLWKKSLGKDLYVHLKLRKMLNKFTNKDFNKMVGMLSNDKLNNVLETHSRDKPTKLLIKSFLSEPKLLYFTKKLF